MSSPRQTPVTKAATGFINHHMNVKGVRYPYVVYTPQDYASTRRWPVILFLHGAGERGSDGLKQTQVGLGTALRWHPERYPAVVVMPQCPPGSWWEGELLTVAMKIFDYAAAGHNGDPRRFYLTGLSMGGFGTWRLAYDYPEKFAAVAPICGVGEPSHMARALTHIPTWVFHGLFDQAVPVERSREMVRAIQAAGGTRIRYTEYDDRGHDSWDPAYADPEFPRWLFSQKKTGRRYIASRAPR